MICNACMCSGKFNVLTTQGILKWIPCGYPVGIKSFAHTRGASGLILMYLVSFLASLAFLSSRPHPHRPSLAKGV